MNICLVSSDAIGDEICSRLHKENYSVARVDSLFRSNGHVDKEKTEELDSVFSTMSHPCVLWVIDEIAKNVECFRETIIGRLISGDCFINSSGVFYEDAVDLAASLEAVGIECLDIGIIKRDRISLTIGGNKKAYNAICSIISAVSDDGAFLFCGLHGSGIFSKHLYKMISKDIETAYARGAEYLIGSSFGKCFSINEFLYFMHAFIERRKYIDYLQHDF